MAGATAALALFPLGLYGVADPGHLAAVHRAGFTAIVPAAAGADALDRLGAAARMEGLNLLVAPSARARALPVLAWYLADEPDVTGMSEDRLVALDQKTKAELPGPPTAFVVGDGGDALCYAKAADILMVDWYPVPHLPLNSIGDHVRWTVEAAGNRQVWAVVQAYDWRDQVQRNPAAPRIGRFPTPAELRFMAYLAIARGAQGLFWFTFAKPGGKTLLDFPDQWAALSGVVQELALLAPGLAHGTRMKASASAAPGFTVRAWRDLADEFVLLVNESPAAAATVPAILRQDHWEPLFGGPRPGELAGPSSAVVLRRGAPVRTAPPGHFVLPHPAARHP